MPDPFDYTAGIGKVSKRQEIKAELLSQLLQDAKASGVLDSENGDRLTEHLVREICHNPTYFDLLVAQNLSFDDKGYISPTKTIGLPYISGEFNPKAFIAVVNFIAPIVKDKKSNAESRPVPELTSGKRGFVQELQTFFIENTGKQGKLFTSSESEICVPVEEAVIWTLSGNAWGRYAAIKDIAECKGELIQKRALSIRLMTGKPEDELVADLLDYKKRAETIKDALRKMKKSGSKKSKAKKTTTKRAAAERSTPEAAPKPDPVRSQAISQPIPQTPTPAAEAPLVQSPTRPAAAAPAETKKKETPPPPATPVPPAAEQAVTAPEPPGEISLSDSNTPAAPMVEKDPFFNISILERPSKGGGKEFRAEFEITAPWGAGYFIPTEAKDLFQRVYEGQKEFVIPGPGSPKITISCMPQTEGSVAGLISAGGFKQISKLHSFQVEKCWPFQMTVIIEKGGQQSYGIYTVWFDQSSGLPVAIKDQNSRQKKASEKLKQTGT